MATSFVEKPQGQNGLINGGFFVLSPSVVKYIEDENTPWETKPLQMLVEDKELVVFNHYGFWHPMDTLRDKNYLENLWLSKNSPWKLWK